MSMSLEMFLMSSFLWTVQLQRLLIHRRSRRSKP
ncbi:BnaC06g31230D [Brassica napus]|uniref:BnaC06g31230D protein n=1 Tax=Brassica napus TaxID=3708 RepID=A0A078FED7_BRANA|nr:BnaC06g31230D [Brassica napus]